MSHSYTQLKTGYCSDLVFYKDIMLTYDEWKSLWWADPENESKWSIKIN